MEITFFPALLRCSWQTKMYIFKVHVSATLGDKTQSLQGHVTLGWPAQAWGYEFVLFSSLEACEWKCLKSTEVDEARWCSGRRLLKTGSILPSGTFSLGHFYVGWRQKGRGPDLPNCLLFKYLIWQILLLSGNIHFSLSPNTPSFFFFFFLSPSLGFSKTCIGIGFGAVRTHILP